jgi:hypothetical protein
MRRWVGKEENEGSDQRFGIQWGEDEVSELGSK